MVQSVVGGGGSGIPDFSKIQIQALEIVTRQKTLILNLNLDLNINEPTHRARMVIRLRPPPWKNPVHAPEYNYNV